MPVHRVFLSDSDACLPLAAAHLLADRVIDLAELMVVTPGARAGRRLRELLVSGAPTARGSEAPFFPPQFLTIGALPERLYIPGSAPADDLSTRLGWIMALRSAAPELLQGLFSEPPAPGDFGGWNDLARDLERLNSELAAARLDFSCVADRCEEHAGFSDTSRWRKLSALHAAYLDILGKTGLTDRHQGRKAALASGGLRAAGQIVLVGCLEVSPLLRDMLLDSQSEVTALIFGSKEDAEGYDEIGALRPEFWDERPLSIPDSAIRFADRPRDQAEATLAAIAELDGAYAPDQITVGMGDDTLAPVLERLLEPAGVPARPALGRIVGEYPPCLLLSATAEYLRDPRYETFAALVRHPDLEGWMLGDPAAQAAGLRDGAWLPTLDRYVCEHLASRPQVFAARGPDAAVPAAVHAAVSDLLSPFAGGGRPLSDWSDPISRVLTQIYGSRTLRRERPDERRLAQVLQCLGDRLRQQAALSTASPLTLQVGACDALALLLEAVADQTLPEPFSEPAVELLGWLELYLDDAPALVITGFNEGNIPENVLTDSFLPDTLRRDLGLLDNRRRYARDAAVLHAKLQSCQRLSLIAGRINERGEALTPSRLLFACQEETLLVQRALQYYQEPPPPTAPGRPLFVPGGESLFEVPYPRPLPEPVRRIPVTGFRTYLQCPYRYYLKHVLRLDELDDRLRELDGRLFGNLAHGVLAAFGKSRVRDSETVGDIERFLGEELDRQAGALFGREPSAAVEIQLHQLGRRLRQFARWQARETSEGWRIDPELSEARVETELEIEIVPPVPGEVRSTVTVSGRIDRIDRHAAANAVRLVDYKSGDTARTPEAAHRAGPVGAKEWIDLQLPLYVLLAQEFGVSREGLTLGYVNLPKEAAIGGFVPAPWTASELEDAHNCAREVAGRIVRGEFWPPAEPDPRRAADFAGLCFDRCTNRAALLRAPGGAQ